MTESEFSLKNISSLKTIAMIMVLVYHAAALWLPEGWFNQKPVDESIALTCLAEWLNMVHIYIFVFASGYIFRTTRKMEGKYNSFKDLILKKSERLLFPYVLTCCIWVIPFFGIFYRPTLEEIFLNYVLGYRPSQLWFLLMLFWVFIIGYWTFDIVEKLPVCKLYFSAGIVYICYYLVSYAISLPFQILTAIKFLPFFWLGMSFDRYKKKVCGINIYACVLENVLLYALYLMLKHTDAIEYKLGILLVRFVIHIWGILLFVLVELRLQKFVGSNRVWKYIGKRSFYIYLLHQQVIWIVISAFNGRVNSIFLMLMNLAISITVSLVITEGYLRLKQFIFNL